jgi:hypothetical protein
MDSAFTACEELVRENWPAIEEVASRLLEQKRLTGAEVEAIVRRTQVV